MPFHKLNMADWDRREIYDYFQGTAMYTTVQLDITGFLTRVRRENLRFYPAMIYCIARVVNENQDYRYGYDREQDLGRWDRLHPLYTVPRGDKPHLFSMASTPYEEDFQRFYAAFLEDCRRAEHCGRLFSQPLGEEDHYIGVTAMPGVHFSSFAFGDKEGKPDLKPFVVLGGYRMEKGRTLLPVTGEFAHSVNDGYHITRFFRELERVTGSFLD